MWNLTLKCEYWRLTQANCKVLIYHFVANFIFFLRIWGRFSWFCLWKCNINCNIRLVVNSNYYNLLLNTLFILDASLQGITPSKLTSHINDRVVLIVKAFRPGRVVWHFNGEVLPQSNSSKHFKFPDCKHYGITHGSVLQIRNIRLRHTGNYRLTYNVSGCIRRHKIFVEVVKKNKKSKRMFFV